MGDIRDKILEQKALDEMDRNAEITDIGVNIDYSLFIKGEYTNGGTTPRGPVYNSKSNTWMISKDTADMLIEMDDRTDWINDNIREYEGFGFARYRKVNSTVKILADIIYDIEYFNGRQITVSESVKIGSQNYYSPLVDLGIGSEIQISEETDEKIEIKTDGSTISCPKTDKSPDDTELSRLVLEYLSVEDVWMNGYMTVDEMDDCLRVVLNAGNTEYTTRFEPPFNNDNKIWELTNEIGYEDPMNLDGERFMFTLNGTIEHGCRIGLIWVTADGNRHSPTRHFLSNVFHGIVRKLKPA